MADMVKTIFIDIDGTILKHQGSLSEMVSAEPEILSDVKDKFNQWNMKNYTIIVVTARPESLRRITEKHLEGLPYDQLIMGLPGGPRVVVNDLKPHQGWENIEMAVGVNLKRDEGLGNVNI